MKELIDAVKKLSDEEGERSMLKHPLFNSHHEGYAIIKEEIEEAEQEIAFINMALERAWFCIKENKEAKTIYKIDDLKLYAINGAAELIQVAAMCSKFSESFNAKEKFQFESDFYGPVNE